MEKHSRDQIIVLQWTEIAKHWHPINYKTQIPNDEFHQPRNFSRIPAYKKLWCLERCWWISCVHLDDRLSAYTCVRTGENIVPKAAKEHPRALDSHTRGFSAAPESHTLRMRESRSSEARAACAWWINFSFSRRTRARPQRDKTQFQEAPRFINEMIHFISLGARHARAPQRREIWPRICGFFETPRRKARGSNNTPEE